MFRWFARSRVQRFVLGLVLATFLPVASATVACQIACASMGAAIAHQDSMAASSAHHRSHSGSTPAKVHEMGRLAHAGPCHLASMPTLCGDSEFHPNTGLPSLLRPVAYLLPASFVGPPPEHKPRA